MSGDQRPQYHLIDVVMIWGWHGDVVTTWRRWRGGDGVVVMPHLHSALGENFSAGDTLTPAAYYALFASHQPRLFSDEQLFNDVVEHRVVDLTQGVSPEHLGTEPALTLVASLRTDLFRRYDLTPGRDVTGELSVNPLIRGCISVWVK